MEGMVSLLDEALIHQHGGTAAQEDLVFLLDEALTNQHGGTFFAGRSTWEYFKGRCILDIEDF